MIELDALVLFAQVVEAGSFSEAARRTRQPVSTVSRRIADLEERLGVRLLERTTRKLRVTTVGAEIFAQAQRGADIGEAVAVIVSDSRSGVSGLLRLSAPPSIADTLVAPLMSAFQAKHPDIRFDVVVTDRPVDLIAENVDLSFTGTTRRETTLIATKLLAYRHQLVASPAYLSAHAPIEEPRQLLDRRLLGFSRRKPHNRWTFQNAPGGEQRTISFDPYVAMNDFGGLVHLLREGVGIGALPPIVQPHLLRDGALLEVMPDWRFRAFDLSLIHVGGRHVPRALRVFKDFAVKAAPTWFRDLPR